MGQERRRPLVVMGTQGTGKSTIGALLATARGERLIDGDDLHPPANKEKMRGGTPLTDDDRAPWLEVIGATLGEGGVVVACSALRRRYRDAIRRHEPDAVFVHLDGDRQTLLDRLTARTHEYMPTTLLDSQLATLEPLQDDEDGLRVSITLPPQMILERIEEELRYRRW